MTNKQRKARMEQLSRKAWQAANIASLNQQAGRTEEAVRWSLMATFYVEARIALRKGKEEPEYKGQNTIRGALVERVRSLEWHEEDKAVELQFA